MYIYIYIIYVYIYYIYILYVYVYIWPRQTHIHHIPVRFKKSVIESNGRVQSRNLPTSHPNPPPASLADG